MSEQYFDPSRYLTKVGSSDYLEVKWRLVWLRDQHPDAHIDTELISHDLQSKTAVFKATISLKDGGSAVGHGSEDINGFREYFEKAETKAIGRALAALGFGTQFCQDFDFAENTGRVVDSPVGAQNGAGRTMDTDSSVYQPRPHRADARPTIQNPDAQASESQVNYIRGLAKQLGMVTTGPDGEMHTDEDALAAVVHADFNATWPQITKGSASEIIEALKDRSKRQAAR